MNIDFSIAILAIYALPIFFGLIFEMKNDLLSFQINRKNKEKASLNIITNMFTSILFIGLILFFFAGM